MFKSKCFLGHIKHNMNSRYPILHQGQKSIWNRLNVPLIHTYCTFLISGTRKTKILLKRNLREKSVNKIRFLNTKFISWGQLFRIGNINMVFKIYEFHKLYQVKKIPWSFFGDLSLMFFYLLFNYLITLMALVQLRYFTQSWKVSGSIPAQINLK